MPSEATRQILKRFGVAVTNLEDALDRNAPVDEIARLDRDVAERMRELTALVERIRSRRIA